VFLIDFGGSKKYINKKGRHRKQRDMLRFIGSPAFAAITSHKNKSQSRKDDLEALFYVLFYFTTGELPWGKAALIEDKTKVMEAILKIKTNAFADGEYNGIPKSLL